MDTSGTMRWINVCIFQPNSFYKKSYFYAWIDSSLLNMTYTSIIHTLLFVRQNIEYGCAAIRHRYQKNYDSQYNEYGQYQKCAVSDYSG